MILYHLSMLKVAVVIPVWNEVHNVKKMIDELFEVHFPKIEAEMHLLIVDNHSNDGTEGVVKDFARKYKNLEIIQQQNKGLGWAYVTGFKYAINNLKADAVMEMDGDFQHPPRFVKPMVDSYLAGSEYCIGSRYIKGGSVPKEWQLSRKAVSYLGNLFIRLVLLKPSLHDLTTGFRLTKVKGVLDQIDLENLMELDRFAYKVDLLYQSVKLSKKTVEVPLEFAPRTMEKSKFNPKEMIATFKVAIILGIKDKMRFIKFGIVGGTGFIVNYLGLELLKMFGLSTYWSTLLATELAIISNFTFNNIWTFKDKEIKRFRDILVQFGKFNLTSIFAVIFQPLIVSLGTYLFGDTSIIRLASLLFALIFVLIYNYTVYNLFIWKTWKNPFVKRA